MTKSPGITIVKAVQLRAGVTIIHLMVQYFYFSCSDTATSQHRIQKDCIWRWRGWTAIDSEHHYAALYYSFTTECCWWQNSKTSCWLWRYKICCGKNHSDYRNDYFFRKKEDCFKRRERLRQESLSSYVTTYNSRPVYIICNKYAKGSAKHVILVRTLTRFSWHRYKNVRVHIMNNGSYKACFLRILNLAKKE